MIDNREQGSNEFHLPTFLFTRVSGEGTRVFKSHLGLELVMSLCAQEDEFDYGLDEGCNSVSHCYAKEVPPCNKMPTL